MRQPSGFGPSAAEQIQRATNKAEAYNGFAKRLHFGNAGWLTSRDPEPQDKAVKFLDLLAAGMVFSTTIDMTPTLRQMARESWTLHATDLAILSPYRRENVLRFGDYTTDQLHIPPPACNPNLAGTEETGQQTACDDQSTVPGLSRGRAEVPGTSYSGRS